MTAFKRDKDTCLSRLVTSKNGSVLTRARCRIQIPERWMSVGLGSITDVTSIYGFFPIIFEDNTYTVMSVCALMDITPSRTTMVSLDGDSYYEFHFDKDDTIIKSTKLVRQDTLTFNVLDEFVMKGKVPWWATVDDLCSIFDTADKHAGSKIAKVPQTIEFLIGVTARKREERIKSLRQTAKSFEDYDLNNIEFIPLKSVLEAVNNTLAKLSGSYFDEGVKSAIVYPTKESGKIEKILRA